jgi:hypothetical protein
MLDELGHLVEEVISHLAEPDEETITLDLAANGAVSFAVIGRWPEPPTRGEIERYAGAALRHARRWGVSPTPQGAARVWFEAPQSSA